MSRLSSPTLPTPARSAAITRQIDLFAASSNPPSEAEVPIDPLHRISVQLPDTCQCGSRETVIGEGKGPHRASLFCRQCGKHCGSMPNEARAFVTTIVQKFGKPTTPIRIRRKQSKEITSELSSELPTEPKRQRRITRD